MQPPHSVIIILEDLNIVTGVETYRFEEIVGIVIGRRGDSGATLRSIEMDSGPFERVATAEPESSSG